MANQVQTSPPGDPETSSLTGLVKGIVNDVGDLIKQQLRFAQAEVKKDLRQTGEASRLLGIGVGVALLGLVVLVFMPVHLLHWLTSPPGTDPATLPLWSCYGIVGLFILAVGGSLAYAGKKKFDSFNPLPEETVQTMKENLQWATNSK
jgi:drug/metabolite transporter (DMT)-like permease